MKIPDGLRPDEWERMVDELSPDEMVGIAHKLVHDRDELEKVESKLRLSDMVILILLKAYNKQRDQMSRPPSSKSSKKPRRSDRDDYGKGGVMRRDPEIPPTPKLRHNPFMDLDKRVRVHKKKNEG
jgi:hypothetical protein